MEACRSSEQAHKDRLPSNLCTKPVPHEIQLKFKRAILEKARTSTPHIQISERDTEIIPKG